MFEVNVTSLKDRKTFNRQMVIKQFVSNNTNQKQDQVANLFIFLIYECNVSVTLLGVGAYDKGCDFAE